MVYSGIIIHFLTNCCPYSTWQKRGYVMNDHKMTDRKNKILMGMYGSSLSISMTALTIVVVLELIMLGYTVMNPALYGPYIGRYRLFYLSLLLLAVVYIALNTYVKRDLERRFVVLNISNPLCAIFFFVWSIGVTYSDASVTGVVDPTIFMTFSLVVPLSFSLLPAVYAVIVGIADALMLSIIVAVTGSGAPIINVFIFFIFQFVLGVSFLRTRKKLAERIVTEAENADIDVMTGLLNRRVYEEDMKRLAEAPGREDLIYLAIDINGLKGINDQHGHDAGDRQIIGTAQCIAQCFGEKGTMYLIGGDEFAVLLYAQPEELEALLSSCEKSLASWSDPSGITLSASFGHAGHAEFPEAGIIELARTADTRMYAAKAHYYQGTGKDRRRHPSGVFEPAEAK